MPLQKDLLLDATGGGGASFPFRGCGPIGQPTSLPPPSPPPPWVRVPPPRHLQVPRIRAYLDMLEGKGVPLPLTTGVTTAIQLRDLLTWAKEHPDCENELRKLFHMLEVGNLSLCRAALDSGCKQWVPEQTQPMLTMAGGAVGHGVSMFKVKR